VHEGVAAHEQVETRDRRILDQVQVPEDDRLAQLLAEDVAGCRALEVPVAEVGGDGLEILGAVASLPGLRDRVLVDVGGVDLDALAHTPREARPLVPGEVESAAAPQMLEQRLERPAVFHVLHCICPFISVTSADAISSRGSTKSTLPLSMAAPGMPKNSDVRWSWAMTVPPIFLMALTPIEPSPP